MELEWSCLVGEYIYFPPITLGSGIGGAASPLPLDRNEFWNIYVCQANLEAQAQNNLFNCWLSNAGLVTWFDPTWSFGMDTIISGPEIIGSLEV